MASSGRAPYLVLITGHSGAGKSTLAPKIGAELDVVCISNDTIQEMVFDAWRADPATSIDGDTLSARKLGWGIFFWMIEQVLTSTPVVAETPFNQPWNRDMFESFRGRVTAPIIEVALVGDPRVFRERIRSRGQAAGAHELKKSAVTSAEPHLRRTYQPVMATDRVLWVDTTEVDKVDPAQLAGDIERLLDDLG